MCDLVALLQQCEDDTCRFLGRKEANRLGNWRNHAESEAALVTYIRKLLTGDHRLNGWKLENSNGLSLERIVIDRCPQLFEKQDREEARKTLGLPPEP